jgi:hypothetical protein
MRLYLRAPCVPHSQTYTAAPTTVPTRIPTVMSRKEQVKGTWWNIICESLVFVCPQVAPTIGQCPQTVPQVNGRVIPGYEGSNFLWCNDEVRSPGNAP